MDSIKVLNHGLVRLIDSMGSDLAISRNARVSYNAEFRAGEDKDREALNFYIMIHKSMIIHLSSKDFKIWHKGQEIYTNLQRQSDAKQS